MKITTVSFVLSSLAAGAMAQWATPPPATADPSTIKECSYWAVVGDSDVANCQTFASDLGIEWKEFKRWNPVVKDDCKGMKSGYAYCVEAPAAPEPEPTPTTTEPPPTPTKPSNGIKTPEPLQPGITDDCKTFYFVKDGDDCASISAKHNIPLDEFVKWNPSVKKDCTGLWKDTYVCVLTLSFKPPPPPKTTEKPPTPTKPSNGITTPSPVQPGIVSDCKTFHFVKSGESCTTIAENAKIPLDQFKKWNPAIKSDCTGMWANAYVCIMTLSFKPPPPPVTTTKKPPTPTTKPGNGVTTPSPLQPGIPNNCKTFHKVKDGETCAKIAADAKISVDQFVKWNTSVKKECTGLWKDAFVCTMTLDFKPPPPTPTKKPEPTKPGNGIKTPSPTQDGQPANCKEWYKVAKGETCESIGKKKKLTVDQIWKLNKSVGRDCKGLWANVYLCIKT